MGEEQRNLEVEGGAMEGGRRPTGVAPADPHQPYWQTQIASDCRQGRIQFQPSQIAVFDS
jgi:hypothetical protein